MSVVDEGPDETEPERSAPVFLLLHGNYTWSFLYRDLIGRLRQRHRVVAPDMIGFGLSEKPESTAYHSLRRHISNLTALVEALDLRDMVLVLHGWGGPIGLAYAGSHSQNVSRLVLVNTWSEIPPRGKGSKTPLHLRLAEWGRAGQWLDSWFNLSMHSVFASHAGHAVRDLALEGYTYPFHHRASPAAITAFSRMFVQPDKATVETSFEIEEGLGRITAPADILCGAQDHLLSKLPGYWLRDRLKHAREPRFSEVGHFLPEEAPEVLAETVLRPQQATLPKEKAKDRLFEILP